MAELDPPSLAALLGSPALAPPPGIDPQFDSPPNQNGLAYGITTALSIILSVCVAIRLYARIGLERQFRVEDGLMLLGYGSYWGTAYAAYELIKTPGYYVHTWDLHLGDMIRPGYLILIYGCCYSAVLPLIKTAILLDWCRIFVTGNRIKSPFWWGCMALSVLQCVWGLMCIILLNMQCVPHNAIWEFYVPSKCYSLPRVMLASASVQVVTDIAMVLLPQRLIWKLQTGWKRKAGISLIFGIGIAGSISACLRLERTITYANESDKMYFIGPLLFWACAEMTCGFLIFCVPSMPRIFKTMFDMPIKSGGTVEPLGDDYYRARRKWAKPTSSVSRGTWKEIDDGDIALTRSTPAEGPASSAASTAKQHDSESSR
ncbi:uncharacterized protein B0I36DRAFT_415395 [Microdochium trichocladiopsis]|uniref:Rhodopsin domain-containing protein n=1 Tax=Microdochium trichocladiopsis TaxID=1682393 RepID=A0A9P8Y293_9PEZI|nr:uncharacterized protein B0I36DRAFT_415395 [Microdochium trichocladiopsis]KAH7026716.1 hypothetical protein B0I36DRAFT_415395 [Microdochium trichocladiopsis]